MPPGDGLVPAGHALEVVAGPSTGFYSKGARMVGTWPQMREFSFWVYRSQDEARRQPKSTLEVQFLERDGRSRFWRRVDLDHQGWKRVALPLAWCRWGGNHVPRWEEIDRLGLYFRDEANLWIDNIGVLPGDERQGAEPTDAQLMALAFPGKPASELKRLRTADVCIMSDAADLEIDKLAGHLAKVAENLRADLPFLERRETGPRIFVFSTREAYQAFIPRLAEQLASQGAAPQSDGFTMQGMATSYWDPRQGTLRPVYTHEYVHAWVGRSALLDNRGEWFHEGLATLYQLRFSPQANFAQIVRRGIVDPQGHLPLEKLAHGDTLPISHYWQACTLVELLMTDDKYRQSLQKLIVAFQTSGSTNLEPQLQPIFAGSWTQLSADWREHCRRKYGRVQRERN